MKPSHPMNDHGLVTRASRLGVYSAGLIPNHAAEAEFWCPQVLANCSVTSHVDSMSLPKTTQVQANARIRRDLQRFEAG